jgi:hypothetical protein
MLIMLKKEVRNNQKEDDRLGKIRWGVRGKYKVES